MVFAVKFFSRSQGFKRIILLSKVVFPLLFWQITNVVETDCFTDKQSIGFALKSSFTKEEGSADENYSCDEVDNTKDDHESELVGAAVAYFLYQIKEGFGCLVITSDFCLPLYPLPLIFAKGHIGYDY